MSKLFLELIKGLEKKVLDSTKAAVDQGLLPDTGISDIAKPIFESPNNRANGNLSTNFAMVNAKNFKMSPQKIAEIIKKNFYLENKFVENVEVASGFINFFLNQNFYKEVLLEILDKKENFGRTNFGNNKRVLLEFVSANPTGPMHLGNARGGAYGDFMAEILKFTGFSVHKEFYVNDAGNQIEKFGKSLVCRFKQEIYGEESEIFPEDGYHGDDIRENVRNFIKERLNNDSNGDLCKKLLKNEVDLKNELVKFSLNSNISVMHRDLDKYKVFFDEWFSESTLHKSGAVRETVMELKKLGYTHESDGAIWYEATRFGNEKDEVLVRKNGIPTYFATDIAYHRNKFLTRKFDICIDVWGADHHGHISRMKGAMKAFGINPENFHVVLYQLVRLMKNGEVMKMSKRTGQSLTLFDFLDEVPANSAKFVFNTKDINSPIDFDVDVIKKQDAQNPVYYIQYAYARISGILKKNLSDIPNDFRQCDFNALNSSEEKELIFHLSRLSFDMNLASKTYNPCVFTNYMITLATLFHKFYNARRVISEDKSVSAARLCLCKCTATVLKSLLNLVHMDAPEEM